MIRVAFFSAIAAAAYFIAVPDAQAHGGRTDASGCHRERATGERHCHNGGSTSQSLVGSSAGSGSKKKRSKGKKRRR